MKSKKPKKPKAKVKVVVGIGLDATDGVKRVTRTEEGVLVGGSKETHEQMQETSIKFSEGLEKIGKKLSEVSPQQAMDILREAIERTGR